MVTVRSFEIPSPAAEWIQTLPIGCEWRVIFGVCKVGTPFIEVQVNCETDQMQAVGDSLATFSIELRDAGIPKDFPHSNFVTLGEGKIEKTG